MTAETFDHTFNHQSLGEYNDEVYQSKVFDLKDSEYTIQLTPGQATLYWRFGLALSVAEAFDFQPQHGRYNNQDLRFVEINVGARTNEKWENPGYIQLSSYYINDTQPPFDATGTYEPGTMVEFNIRYSEGQNGAPNEISFSYITTAHSGKFVNLPIGEYRYFKIFAWADHTSFQLQAHILMFKRDGKIQYWLLRLMSQTWDFDKFSVGQAIWHGSHTGAGKRRVEYSLYKQVRKGDRVLGLYVGESQAIVCAFEVAEELGIDIKEGEIILLTVTQLFLPYIPLDPYSIYRYSSKDVPEERDKRLFYLEESAFRQLTSSDLDFPKVAIVEPERKYLEILYKNLLEGREINSSYSLSEIWNDDLPKSFSPEQMDPQLVGSGRNLTLLGICQVHPESRIFYEFEQVLYAIQSILGDGKDHSQISSAELQQQLADLPFEQILQISKLMYGFGRLTTGMTKKSDTEIAIGIADNAIYEEYRQFTGLGPLMAKHLKKNPLRAETVAKRLIDIANETAKPADFFRTRGLRRPRADFSPVMGVKLLAEQLANMIYALPPDSQMVGIFGKWGRGKTFLLDEMWAYIEDTWKEQFIKIVYHAWKYQETPASWAYLYEQFAEAYLGKRTGWGFPRYYARLFWLNCRRLGLQPLLSLILLSAALVLWLIYSPQVLDSDWYIWLGSDLLAVVSVSAIFRAFKKDITPKATELIKKYSSRHSYKVALGLQADIQEELIKLLKLWLPKREAKVRASVRPGSENKSSRIYKKWTSWLNKILPKRKPRAVKRIFLLVEDMDRCKEERIIESIDALRVLLEDLEISTRLVIVTAIDERILKNAIRRKYTYLIGETDTPGTPKGSKEDQVEATELISEYIDKLFIAAIKLGELNEDQRVEFLQELIKKDVATEPNSSAKNSSIYAAAAQQDLADSIALQSKGTISAEGETNTGERNAISSSDAMTDSGPALHNALATMTVTATKSDWQGLNSTEVGLLNKIVRSWVNVTPRRISIFYHRYLLCKNTLIGKYLQLGQTHPWQDTEGIQAILSLLRYYSSEAIPEAIDIEKLRVIQEPVDLVQVRHAIPTLRRSKSDYLYLLEILELVVAY